MRGFEGFLKEAGFEDCDKIKEIKKSVKKIEGIGREQNVLFAFMGYKSSDKKIVKNIEKDLQNIKKIKWIKKNKFKIKIIILFDSLSKIPQIIKKEINKKRWVICNENYIKTYKKISKNIGKYTKFSIMKDFGIKKRTDVLEKDLKVNVFNIDLKKDMTCIYFFPIRVDILLKLGYVLRLETEKQIEILGEKKIRDYYQRILKDQKIKSIREFLEKNNFFFNNLILSWDIQNKDFEKDQRISVGGSSGSACFGTLKLPEDYCTIKVVDGQHRLYGFANLNDQIKKESTLLAIAFAEKNPKEEAKIFVQINSKQTPVDTNILWDLYSITGEREGNKGTISLLVKYINNSSKKYLKKNIYIPSDPESYKGVLKIGNVCKSISDNNIIKKNNIDETKKDSFDNFLKKLTDSYKEIEESLGKTNEKWFEGFFLINNGFNILIRLLGSVFNKKHDEKSFKKGLNSFCQKRDLEKIKKETSSEGGRRSVYFDILNECFYNEEKNKNFFEKILIEGRILIKGLRDLNGLFEENIRKFIPKVIKEKLGAFEWKERYIPKTVLERIKKVEEKDKEAGKKIQNKMDNLDYPDYRDIILKHLQIFKEKFGENLSKKKVRSLFNKLSNIRINIRHTRGEIAPEEKEFYVCEIQYLIKKMNEK